MSTYDAWRHGEIGDDGTHPGSPNYIEPEYGEDDAQGEVAEQLIADDEVGALVADVHGAAGSLDWITRNVDLPIYLLPGFRELARRARSISQSVDALLDKRTAA